MRCAVDLVHDYAGVVNGNLMLKKDQDIEDMCSGERVSHSTLIWSKTTWSSDLLYPARSYGVKAVKKIVGMVWWASLECGHDSSGLYSGYMSPPH